MGIRGGFVLAFWRRFFWIAAEVVLATGFPPVYGGNFRGCFPAMLDPNDHHKPTQADQGVVLARGGTANQVGRGAHRRWARRLARGCILAAQRGEWGPKAKSAYH